VSDFTGLTVVKDLPTGDNRAKPDPFTEETDGVWIVYGWDTMPYPLYISKDELLARRYMEVIGYPVFIKFWAYNSEFGRD
jgi:hypothetical protein